MAVTSFFRKYGLLLASIIICVGALLLVPPNSNPLTGRFISTEPTIIQHGWVSIYETNSYLNGTKAYSLLNEGETYLDVLMSSNSDETLIKIYLPGTGWKDLPTNNSGQEICIANDMSPGSALDGYKLQAEGNYSGKLLPLVILVAYNSNTTNPCREAGENIARIK